MLNAILLFSLALIIPNSIAHPVEQLLDSRIEYVHPKLFVAPIAPAPYKTEGKISTYEAQNAPIHRIESPSNGVFGPSAGLVEHKATFDLSPAESAHWGGGWGGGGGGWGHHHHHHGGWGHHHGGGWGHHHGGGWGHHHG